jgi:hypothetical protein
VQDDYKISQKLTLNLGVRWSVDQPRKESKDFTTNFDPDLPNPGDGGHLDALQFATNCGGCNPRWGVMHGAQWVCRLCRQARLSRTEMS